VIGQKGMPVGEVEYRLVRQLFRVVCTRPSLKDDLIIRVNHVKVTNSPAGDTVDVTLDEFGDFQVILAALEPAEFCSSAVDRHARLPSDRLFGRRRCRKQRAELTDWEAVSKYRASRPGNERSLINGVEYQSDSVEEESVVPSLIPSGKQSNPSVEGVVPGLDRGQASGPDFFHQNASHDRLANPN
jgi:hypothetical protein